MPVERHHDTRALTLLCHLDCTPDDLLVTEVYTVKNPDADDGPFPLRVQGLNAKVDQHRLSLPSGVADEAQNGG